MCKLSVVIITYNEERNIARCLESVRDIADDIVVVDSFSTDRTAEICSRYGARFIQNKFAGHIEQKNFAARQAKYDHVLSLDADEELSGRLKASIREVRENWTHDGYYFNRLTNYCGQWIRHTTWYPSRKLRMWDRRKGQWGGLNPHDRFHMQKGARTRFLKGDLLHYSYYTINEHLDKIRSFSDTVAWNYFRHRKRSGVFHIFFRPAWRFVRDFFLRLGFLQGMNGIIISVNSAYETFLKYVKLRDLYLERALSGRESVCFCNTVKSWGGGEKWHYDVSRGLMEEGNQVLVIAGRNSELWKKMQSHGPPVVQARIGNLSFMNPFLLIRLRNMMKREKVKTIILNLSADLKTAGLAARLAGVENIIYRRGLAIPVKNTLLNRFLYRKVITGIIANSRATRDAILANNPGLIDPDRIHVVYNGIRIGEYLDRPSRPVYRRKEDVIVLGNSGRLVRQKGHKYLLEICRKLKDGGLRFRMLIAGEGKLRPFLEGYARELGIGREVHFLGFIKNTKDFMESLDVFLLTSLWEGFGYVLTEAMLCGKPVVAFDLSSNPEIVIDRETGFLVRENDLGQFAGRVMELAGDPELRKKMGRKGKERVIQTYDYSRTFGQVKGIIL